MWLRSEQAQGCSPIGRALRRVSFECVTTPTNCSFWPSKRLATRLQPRFSKVRDRRGQGCRASDLASWPRKSGFTSDTAVSCRNCLAGARSPALADDRRSVAPGRSLPWRAGRIAVATHPGLVGALVVGLTAAKALALALDIPLIAVNHLEGHLYACQLAYPDREVYPCAGLVISGGHTSLYLCHSPIESEFLGGTADDAAGEAFDKVASLLGLAYPGGPEIERLANSVIRPRLLSRGLSCMMKGFFSVSRGSRPQSCMHYMARMPGTSCETRPGATRRPGRELSGSSGRNRRGQNAAGTGPNEDEAGWELGAVSRRTHAFGSAWER